MPYRRRLGRRERVRELITERIKDVCEEYSTDRLGNLICFKKGRKLRRKSL